MSDDKLLEKIRQSADSCEIPEGLKPEHVSELIGRKKKRRHPYGYGIGAAAAAVLILTAGMSMYPLGIFNDQGSTKNELAVQETTDQAGAKAAGKQTTGEQAAGTKGGRVGDLFKTAGNYDEVLKKIQESVQNNNNPVLERDMKSNITMPKAMGETADSAAAQDTGGTNTYTTTNLQVEGVDEGDVVKTDGQYLYILQNNRRIRVIKADAKMAEISTISLERSTGEETVREIYLSGQTLLVVTEGHDAKLEQQEKDTYSWNKQVQSNLYTYDVSDPGKPEMLGKVTQDGSYHTSRKVDGYLYLFTNFYPQMVEGAEQLPGAQTKTFIPSINDKPIKASNIYLPIGPSGSNHLVISSVNIEKPDQVVDQKSILQAPDQFYISSENIYAQIDNWKSGENTSIGKFHFKAGKITGVGAAVVPGKITDTFSLSEHEGNLRVLTTAREMNETQENFVTVLDQGMKKIGGLEGLARGESIYSARFMGTLGYFVTYRNVDPLFTVDFTDPTKPKILGELKVTGFSEYLHFYGENQLLGIGWETDPDTGQRKGLKLSMFDISNPAKVKEVDKTVIKNIDSFPGEYAYKSLLVNAEKNLIGLANTSWENQDAGYHYMVFSYQADKGFKKQMTHTFGEVRSDYLGNLETIRGLCVNDTFYIVDAKGVLAFDMKDEYRKIGELSF